MNDPNWLRQIQAEHRAWALRNFGEHQAYWPLLGVVEEIGELAHAQLKAEQGIRGTQAEHDAAGRDAVGDTIMFLLDYSSVRGWDLQEIIEQTWAEVSQRDWRADPVGGGSR